MSSLRNAFLGICGLVLTACNLADDDHFTVEELTTPEIMTSESIEERWLATILSTMQGETGRYLIQAAQEHGVEIGYEENLNHALGEFNPNNNSITLEVPLGLTPETFDELVLTGRKIMYHELDHAIRHHEGTRFIRGLSGEDQIDGVATTHEAVADITAFIGMSEDAQLGVVPPLHIQFGVPESGHAVYYSVIPAPMADIIMSALPEGEYFHESPEVIDATFSAFYDTGRSEDYTLRYSAHIPDSVLDGYRGSTPLSTVLTEYESGREMRFNDLSQLTSPLNGGKNFAEGLQTAFEEGVFTSEAERLTVRDLINRRYELSQPDGGAYNHLARQRTYDRARSFFTDASPSRIREAFEILPNDGQIILDFMRSCRGKDYLSEHNLGVVEQDITRLEGFMPTIREVVSSTSAMLSSTSELGLRERLQLRELYQQMDGFLAPPSRNRATLWRSDVVQSRHTGNRIACP